MMKNGWMIGANTAAKGNARKGSGLQGIVGSVFGFGVWGGGECIHVLALLLDCGWSKQLWWVDSTWEAMQAEEKTRGGNDIKRLVTEIRCLIRGKLKLWKPRNERISRKWYISMSGTAKRSRGCACQFWYVPTVLNCCLIVRLSLRNRSLGDLITVNTVEQS